MLHRFGLPTRDVAWLSGASVSQVHTELHRRGSWRGVRPARGTNGRLVWPREAVYRVTGAVPGRDDMSQGELAICELLDEAGVELDAGGWAVIQVLFAGVDRGRDPDQTADDCRAFVWLAVRLSDKIDAALPGMTGAAKGRVLKDVQFIRQMLDFK